MEKPAQERKRDRVLDDGELIEVWRACERWTHPFARGVELLILTLARRAELFEASWPEIELDVAAPAIRLPAERVKVAEARSIPLSEPAVAILRTLPRFAEGELVLSFTGRKPIGNLGHLKAELDQRILEARKSDPKAKPMPEWRLHDLRRSGATGLQRLGIRLEVVEAVLGHVAGSRAGIVGVYQRHRFEAEARQALDAWGAISRRWRAASRPTSATRSARRWRAPSATRRARPRPRAGWDHERLPSPGAVGRRRDPLPGPDVVRLEIPWGVIIRIGIGGMGNALCTDDGFGVAVANALATRTLAPGVKVIEVGIGGIHLVQELLSGYDALVIIDAVDRGAPPGTLLVLEPEAPDLDDLGLTQRREILADMHYTVPSRAPLLAKALGALPDRLLVVGCQGSAVDELGLELTGSVRDAVPRAVGTIEAIVSQLSDGSFARPRRQVAPMNDRAGLGEGQLERLRSRDAILQVLFWLAGARDAPDRRRRRPV